MSKETTFGELLREARKRGGKTLGDVADFLGFKVSYISDIEHGRRPPWPAAKVIAVAGFLGFDEMALLRAAAEARGAVELDARNASKAKLQLGAALARSWSGLSDEQAARIAHVLDPKHEE